MGVRTVQAKRKAKAARREGRPSKHSGRKSLGLSRGGFRR